MAPARYAVLAMFPQAGVRGGGGLDPNSRFGSYLILRRSLRRWVKLAKDMKNNNYDWGQWAFPDVQDLAQRILQSTEKPVKSGIDGSDYVRKNYSWDVAAEKIINFVYRIRI